MKEGCGKGFGVGGDYLSENIPAFLMHVGDAMTSVPHCWFRGDVDEIHYRHEDSANWSVLWHCWHHYHLTVRIVGAPQMILQPVFSIFPCSPLPSGTCQTPGLSIPWCCLHTSSSVCLVFFSLSLCLAKWFWPNLMNRRHDHTTAVCVSLQWSGGLCVVHLPAGSWHGLPRW